MYPSMARRPLAVRLVAFVAVLAIQVLAQSTGGRILGRVADPSGMRPEVWSLLIKSVTAGCPRSMKESSRPAMCRN